VKPYGYSRFQRSQVGFSTGGLRLPIPEIQMVGSPPHFLDKNPVARLLDFPKRSSSLAGLCPDSKTEERFPAVGLVFFPFPRWCCELLNAPDVSPLRRFLSSFGYSCAR